MNETKSKNELQLGEPELEPDQMPIPLPSTDSAAAVIGLSGKPTEIISIAAEMMSPVPQQRNAFTEEEVLRVAIEKHWQSKYNQLEELMAKLEDVQHQQQQRPPKPKEEAGPEEFLEDLQRHVRGTRKIDKNELLTPPQVGGISAEIWQPTAVGKPTTRHRHHHLQVATLSKAAAAVERVQTGSRPSPSLSSQTRDQSPSQSFTSSPASPCSSLDNNDEEDLLALDQLQAENNLLTTGIVEQGDSDSSAGKASTVEQRRRRKREKEVRRKVVRNLNDRLRDMGIEEGTPPGITGAALSAARCQLADSRELQKGKWKKFFVIRNRVVAKVNGLVTAGLRRDRRIIQEVLRRQEVKRPVTVAAVADEESVQRLSGDLKSRGEESWKTHEPEEEGSEMSSAPGSANLVTMFNRIQDDGDDTEAEEQESGRRGERVRGWQPDGDEPLRGGGEAPPKPLPRKVIFNLRENTRKLDSLESLDGDEVVAREVQNG